MVLCWSYLETNAENEFWYEVQTQSKQLRNPRATKDPRMEKFHEHPFNHLELLDRFGKNIEWQMSVYLQYKWVNVI